jgi:hypothetical protein
VARPGKKFWKYVARLKQDFPLDRPVSVRTYAKLNDASGARLFGDCSLNSKGFLLRVAHGDEAVCVDSIFHEWSHALLWDADQSHKRRFWDQYSKIYRFYLEDNFEES